MAWECARPLWLRSMPLHAGSLRLGGQRVLLAQALATDHAAGQPRVQRAMTAPASSSGPDRAQHVVVCHVSEANVLRPSFQHQVRATVVTTRRWAMTTYRQHHGIGSAEWARDPADALVGSGSSQNSASCDVDCVLKTPWVLSMASPTPGFPREAGCANKIWKARSLIS